MNEDQLIVLDWLKKQGKLYPIFNLAEIHDINGVGKLSDVQLSYDALTHKEEFELLKEYAEWGLEQPPHQDDEENE